MNLYSYHVFLFPFQWYFTGKEMRNKTLEERTCLPELLKLFSPTKWKRGKYSTDTILNYNEYNYFYEMVRDVLFDVGKEPDKTLVANLVYDVQPDQFTYEFKVCTDPVNEVFKKYSLYIDAIILHLYTTGVGVLSFHLNNRNEEQKSPDDILRINQAGRRIYPPFFGISSANIGSQEQFSNSDFSSGLDSLQKNELAKDFEILGSKGYEDFSRYRDPNQFSTNPFQLPGHINILFRDIPFTVDKSDYLSDTRKVYISPLLDDRMYVVCWYGNDELIKELKANDQDHCRDEDGKLTYLKHTWWYKFVFNDQKDMTCQNPEMMQKLMRKHTYARWSDYGTFYGVNRYSFVCLTGSLENLKRFNAAFLVNHMQTMYYKLCELCLVQRACILRFSDEVSRISNMSDNKKIPLSERVSNLYKQYIRFVDRIYFREITAQEQGIELYNMVQEHMQIERNVKDLDKEIEELHSYITLVEEKKQNRNIELLTIIGALFILPSFITGFFGMIILPQMLMPGQKAFGLWKSILLILPLIVGPVIYLMIDKRRNRKWDHKLLFLLSFLVIVAILITLVYMFIFIPQQQQSN